jgi:hypothetical protein
MWRIFFGKFPNLPLLDSPAHFLLPSGENSPKTKASDLIGEE